MKKEYIHESKDISIWKLGLKELVAMGVGGMVGGWLLLTGHIGRLALYAYTFGVYGAAMFGKNVLGQATQYLLETKLKEETLWILI